MASWAKGNTKAIERAAMSGDTEAMYELGLMHSLGQGVAYDLVEAHVWFNLAALSGHAVARSCRADVALDMAEADVARAQRLARERKAAMAQQPAAPAVHAAPVVVSNVPSAEPATAPRAPLDVVIAAASLTNAAPPRKQGTSGGVAERLKAAVC